MLSLGMLSSIGLVACNSGGNTTNTNQQLVISSTDSNPYTFIAAIGSTATHTYQAVINSNVTPPSTQYTISVQLPNSAFSIESNGCINVTAGKPCNIQIGFAPLSVNDYAPSDAIDFSVGELESSIIVKTSPQ